MNAHRTRCMSVDCHRCRAVSYVFRGRPIDLWSCDDRQSDEHACRLIFMHINALDSVHMSAHWMHTVRCMSVDCHRCRANSVGSYVFRGRPIDLWSCDVRQSNDYACRVMQIDITVVHIIVIPSAMPAGQWLHRSRQGRRVAWEYSPDDRRPLGNGMLGNWMDPGSYF